MRIDILTLFPEMFEGVLSASMLGRAQANGLLDIRVHNIRDYTDNKHRKADDYPFGGGAGLVMMAQPIYDCMDAVLEGEHAHRILMTPRGRTPMAEAIRQVESQLQDEGRVLVRYSGTQNMCRVMVEGPSVELTERYCTLIADELRKALG